MTTSRSQISTGALLLVAAVSLHWFEYLSKGESGASVWFLLWPLTPYVVCLVEFFLSVSGIPAIAGAILALVLDTLAFGAASIHPRTFTSALALLFTPLCNTIIFVPAAVL